MFNIFKKKNVRQSKMNMFTIFTTDGEKEVVYGNNLTEANKNRRKTKGKSLDFNFEGGDCTSHFEWINGKWKAIKRIDDLF